MKPAKFKHRILGAPVLAVQVVDGNHSKVAKWCKGVVKGRGKDKSVYLNEKDGRRQAKTGWWVIKIFDSYITVGDRTFKNVFVSEEDYIPVEKLED